MAEVYRGLIARYRQYLPLSADCEAVTLLEGNTPLIELKRLPDALNLDLTIFVKFEGLNPTGSFKDRGMTVAVSQARAEGAKAVICASTGNTSAAAAAYAARAGMKAFVLIPQGNIAFGKLAQAIVHGAVVLQLAGNFDDGMAMVKSLAGELELAIVNSINPYRLQGQKTAAFEICEQLAFEVADYHCLPVGNAGNISAYWMGYREFFEAGKIAHCPRMLGYQAQGAAPLVQQQKVTHPQTLATAIRIGAPQSWALAMQAMEQSQGHFASCSDQAILQAQSWLASLEGIFCEPASAISIAGLVADYREGKIKPGSRVVCTLTGHGLKDPDIVATEEQRQALIQVAVDKKQIADIISAS